jgi:Flp pilus assembly pilin Flp
MISVRRFGKREDGQDLLEYGLLASLIAIFAMAAIRLMASSIIDVFWGQIANIQLF